MWVPDKALSCKSGQRDSFLLRSNKPQSLDQRAKRADARAAFRGSFDRGGATGANSFAARSREADKGIRTLDIQLGKLVGVQRKHLENKWFWNLHACFQITLVCKASFLHGETIRVGEEEGVTAMSQGASAG